MEDVAQFAFNEDLYFGVVACHHQWEEHDVAIDWDAACDVAELATSVVFGSGEVFHQAVDTDTGTNEQTEVHQDAVGGVESATEVGCLVWEGVDAQLNGTHIVDVDLS